MPGRCSGSPTTCSSATGSPPANRAADGTRIDLRNIRSPIIVFCSHGDNITPAAAGARVDHRSLCQDSEIVANGQTIVYTLHQSIGHLGIFVSGKVATKEHGEFASAWT